MTFQKAIVNEKKRIHIVIELPFKHLYAYRKNEEKNSDRRSQQVNLCLTKLISQYYHCNLISIRVQCTMYMNIPQNIFAFVSIESAFMDCLLHSYNNNEIHSIYFLFRLICVGTNNSNKKNYIILHDS